MVIVDDSVVTEESVVMMNESVVTDGSVVVRVDVVDSVLLTLLITGVEKSSSDSMNVMERIDPSPSFAAFSIELARML